MGIAVFSSKPHDRRHLASANEAVGSPHALTMLEDRLGPATADLAADHDAVWVFVNDDASEHVLEELTATDVRVVLTRSAGFNHVDLVAADRLGLPVLRVPAYSPYAVAEHTVALLLDEGAFATLPKGALVVNTSRGGLVDSRAAVAALKSGHLGGLAIDVYEEEADLFFEDRSEQVLTDDTFALLLSFPNVLVTAHQGFFTTEALDNIAATTIDNASQFEQGDTLDNRVPVPT